MTYGFAEHRTSESLMQLQPISTPIRSAGELAVNPRKMPLYMSFKVYSVHAVSTLVSLVPLSLRF